MLMIIQNRDGSLTKEPGRSQVFRNKHQGYYAVVPANLLDCQNTIIDELIGFAFDTLGAWHLEVRVHDKTGTRALAEAKLVVRDRDLIVIQAENTASS
jgi:hypothetical protein